MFQSFLWEGYWYLAVDIQPGGISVEKSEDGCHESARQPVTFQFQVSQQEPTVTIGASVSHRGISVGASQSLGGDVDVLFYGVVDMVFVITTEGEGSCSKENTAIHYTGISEWNRDSSHIAPGAYWDRHVISGSYSGDCCGSLGLIRPSTPPSYF